jgi:predicted house-cleaning noncanonical NTP pyrophosphatase (MazG superfamily)
MTEISKAIRDKIPEIIKESGTKCNVKTLSDKEFLEKMEKKLDEEVAEYHQSKSVEEIADIMEVLERIAELRGASVEELIRIKNEKSQKRGKFEKNLFLVDTDEN